MTRIAEIAARVADPAYYPACPGPKADILKELTDE